MNRKEKVVLLLILLLAAFLRLYRLGSFPALNADEAAIGYNAYSLIETGKDEHGNPWPIHFQSFNDYKPGLYFYLVLPFVKFFGLNEWAVRLPGALLGVGTVWAICLLVGELGGLGILGKPRGKEKNQLLALLSSLFLAISPWHIHFSRGGWEVNVATFFITLGLLFFVKARKKLPILILSAISFALSLYTYHAARVVVPLLGLGLLVIYWDCVKGNLKNYFLMGFVGLVVILPLARDFIRPEISSRAAGVGIFSDFGPIERINEQRGEHNSLQGIVPRILHNKLINYNLAFLENWSEHFHGEFLFLSGDEIQRNRVPETGQMYFFDLVFLVAGGIGLIREIRERREGINNRNKNGWLVVCWWLIVAPSAAALTFQSPHALRAHNMVIPLVIISAGGLIYLSSCLHKVVKKKRVLDVIFILFLAVISWNFTRYLHTYWVHMAKEYPFSSQYGLKELAKYVDLNEHKYERIIVTNKYDQPYILFLFYLKYPPEKFQEEHELSKRDKFGFSTVEKFGKYEFREIDFHYDQPNNPGSLIVGTDKEIPNEANVVKEICGSNGYKYFQIVAN